MYTEEQLAPYAGHPRTIVHEGRIYRWTGKVGTNIATGLPVVELEDDAADRIWAAADGTVFPD